MRSSDKASPPELKVPVYSLYRLLGKNRLRRRNILFSDISGYYERADFNFLKYACYDISGNCKRNQQHKLLQPCDRDCNMLILKKFIYAIILTIKHSVRAFLKYTQELKFYISQVQASAAVKLEE